VAWPPRSSPSSRRSGCRPARGELAAAAAYLGVDKKRRGERLRLPLVVEVGRGEVLPVLADDLRAAMRRA
jgi:3-dehydroquinate synthetase